MGLVYFPLGIKKTSWSEVGSLFQEYEKCEKYKRTLKKDKASTSPLRNFVILQFLISNTTEPTCFRKSFSQIFISCSLANCPSPLLLSLCFYFLLLLLYSSLSASPTYIHSTWPHMPLQIPLYKPLSPLVLLHAKSQLFFKYWVHFD